MTILCTASQRELHEQSKLVTTQLDHDGWRSQIYQLNTGAPVPDPTLFQEFKTKESDPAPLPTIAQCAAHLELLQAINHTRRQVLNSTQLDEKLGIIPHHTTIVKDRGYSSEETVKLKDKTFTSRRDKKWQLYLQISVVRFFDWLKKMDAQLSSDGDAALDLPCCPPLDVLVAWHSALLNPDWFRRYCERNRIRKMRRVNFPWSEIHRATNPNDWTFVLPPDQADQFEALTGQEPDLVAYLLSPKPDGLSSLLTSIMETNMKTFGAPGRISELRQGLLEPVHRAFLDRCRDINRQTEDAAYLNAAIERQRVFVDKMVGYLWICSPAARGTLSRAIDRYDHFVQLFNLCPGTVLVPTLDIDLVWHTHQCSASVYEAGLKMRAGRFVNHDDTIHVSVLRSQADETSVLFRKYFGMEYHVCLCWECEAVQSAVDRLEDQEIPETDFDPLATTVTGDLMRHRAREINRRKGNSVVQ